MQTPTIEYTHKELATNARARRAKITLNNFQELDLATALQGKTILRVADLGFGAGNALFSLIDFCEKNNKQLIYYGFELRKDYVNMLRSTTEGIEKITTVIKEMHFIAGDIKETYCTVDKNSFDLILIQHPAFAGYIGSETLEHSDALKTHGVLYGKYILPYLSKTETVIYCSFLLDDEQDDFMPGILEQMTIPNPEDYNRKQILRIPNDNLCFLNLQLDPAHQIRENFFLLLKNFSFQKQYVDGEQFLTQLSNQGIVLSVTDENMLGSAITQLALEEQSSQTLLTIITPLLKPITTTEWLMQLATSCCTNPRTHKLQLTLELLVNSIGQTLRPQMPEPKSSADMEEETSSRLTHRSPAAA